ncbi:LacI family DNA-binding transcriptional regulator [Microbispora bryophytorum]|uniref:LacI family DNA-binding transcriptional regulator n=1 Tax=Microbispora bryophytorum TaxID=1460882 RepID=UPI0033D6FE82
MATIRELARLCCVSPATVSRVFDNPEVVNAKTREQVLRTGPPNRLPAQRVRPHPGHQEILHGLTSGDTGGERTEDAYVRAVRRHNLDGVMMIDLTGGEAGRPAARAAWWRSCPRG